MLIHAVLEVRISPGEQPREAVQTVLNQLVLCSVAGRPIIDWTLNEAEDLGTIPHFGHRAHCDCGVEGGGNASAARFVRVFGIALEFAEFEAADLGRYALDGASQLWLFEFTMPLERERRELRPVALVDPDGRDWRELPSVRRLRLSAGLTPYRAPVSTP